VNKVLIDFPCTMIRTADSSDRSWLLMSFQAAS